MIPLHDENPTSRRPVVTIALIAACCLVYFLVQPSPFASTVDDVLFTFEWAVIPNELLQQEPQSQCEVARVVTDSFTAQSVCGGPFAEEPFAPGKNVLLAVLVSLFLHGSVLHLAGNMLFLWVFGNNVEDRLGPVPFAVFYVAAGIVATLGQAAIDVRSGVPLVGASGAVAGVMGAYLVWYPRARVLTLFFVFLVFWFRIPAAVLLVAWLVLQFFTNPNEGVAWVAHVAGFAFGVVVGLAVGRPRPPVTPWQPSGWPPPASPWPAPGA